MMKVLITDGLAKEGRDILEETGKLDLSIKSGLSPQELLDIIGGFEAIIVRSATKVTREVIERGGDLRVIGRAGTGVDNIDIETASKRGIVVMNTPGGNTVTTAEHTIAMVLSLARKIPPATASLKAGKWEKKKFTGTEIFNKTIGIIGFGKVGSVVADRAMGLKMKVVVYDPFISKDLASRKGFEVVSLDELYRRSHIITVHTPMTPDTKGMLNRDSFSKMRQGVLIMNCARGGIIVMDDLYQSIVDGKIGGCAMDVFDPEPPPHHPLFDLEEVILTPHLGAATSEAQVNVAKAVAEQIKDYLLNGTIRNAVNVPSVSADILKQLDPYLKLGEKIGMFLAQLEQRRIDEVRIEYSGSVVEFGIAPITVAILKGLLSPILEESVNFINAPYIARERGMKVIESKSREAQDFASLITLRVKGDAGESVVAGALFGMSDPRIVRFNDFTLEAVPEGHLLIINNNDVPGVIGTIGTVLGSKGINIGQMQLGRRSDGERAISVINIDSSVSDEVLNELKESPNILSVKQVVL